MPIDPAARQELCGTGVPPVRTGETPVPHSATELARYSRQMLVPSVGEEGQRRLLASRVVLVGCGALGTVLANTLVRAGVGYLRIIDRDFIEPNNLQRQVLFDEDDIAANLPKAEAARRKLQRINSGVRVEAAVTDVTWRNIESLADGADLLLDGTDNFETRYLINDLAVKTHRPWVYGACIGATGLAMPILPGEGPCLRCVFESAPPPEMSPTCDTAGVLGPAVNIVASHQALEAMKLLMGRAQAVNRRLLSIDLWRNRVSLLDVGGARSGDCPCCGRGEFEYLGGKFASSAITMCGREAVQVAPPAAMAVDFAALAARLAPVCADPPRYNEYMLKARVGRHELTVFPDGRAIIYGTNKAEEARTVYSKYVGG